LTDENRPNPDELLAYIRKEEELSNKGKLKIFFGMCAGVGKTSSMLKAALIEKNKGQDIVIGYVETHKRKETDALVEGFEIIPRKSLEYKNTPLQEMDIDAILSRRPQIVLVDEFAHTNAPGSRHLKRYQDVLELLENGINVYTTVNVQHLESRVDTVSQITGIIIRETIPDEIFEKADELEIVDITPEELLSRLAEGKVYIAERTREAVQNFFRKGNITALREMSLRIVAERVDKQLKTYMGEKRIKGPWKSGMHLMVAIGPSPFSANLIRWAKNLSYTMGATLLAVYVEPAKEISKTQKEQLAKNINLSKQVGAEFITTSGDDFVKAILSIAQKENITQIIIGKPRSRNFFSLFALSSYVHRLIRNSGNIDVYVLGSNLSDDYRYKRFILFPSFRSNYSQYLLSVIIISLLTGISYPFLDYLGYQSISFILLFAVSILATFLGIGPILLASTLSALSWDYFFIPPQFTFHISRPEDALMFFMFFFIALINGVLTSRVRKQERLARDREERTYALYKLTNELSVVNNQLSVIIEIATKYIKKYFDFEAVFILQDENNKLKNYYENKSDVKIPDNEYSIASWTLKNSKKAGKFTDTLPSGELTYYPLPASNLKIGVIAVKQKEIMTADKAIFWDRFLSQIANAIERDFLNRILHKTQFIEESERLYKTLFNSISHELRIPVSTIMGASEAMNNEQWAMNNAEMNKELTGEIYKASKRLNRLIENLLNMSRLESGIIKPKSDWCDVRDIINKVTESLEDELKSYNLQIVIPEDMPLIKIDFGLIEQALYNLVYNSCLYSPPKSNIRIKTYYDSNNFFIQVMDRGKGLAKESIPLLFNKFYRVESSKAGGIGLGLSIVKGFVEAHKGTIIAENRQNGGAIFTIKIPTEQFTDL
jgi:two-component system, OmpR family, sensor histidine kinase KdpD